MANLTRRQLGTLLVSAAAASASYSSAAATAQDGSPDERAKAVEQQMTDDERFSLIISLLGAVPTLGVPRDKRIPEAVTNMSAGFTPGIPRLGIPALQSSDASMGVTNPGYRLDDKGATAFPASIVVGASFNPKLARDGGEAIGREARVRGFNIMLAGGVNITRDPRNGRNFEYYSEDPFHSAVLAAEAVNGIQGEGVISTLKHYALNCNETNRHCLCRGGRTRSSRLRPASTRTRSSCSKPEIPSRCRGATRSGRSCRPGIPGRAADRPSPRC